MKRILITGGAGLLGSTLIRSAPPGLEVHATRRSTPVERQGRTNIRPGWSRDASSPRPRDLRLLTTRADRMLGTRARPISALMWSTGG